MQTKPLIPATLCALLVASPFAMAQGADDDTAGTTATSGTPPAAQATPSGAEAQAPAMGGMDMSGSGMMGGGSMDGQSGEGAPAMGNGTTSRVDNGQMGGQQEAGAGVMGGQPGPGSRMMGKGMMMGGQQGQGRGMMGCKGTMGKGGGEGMMAGMRQGGEGAGMGMKACSGEDHGVAERYKRLQGRLDLLEARMAMMQTLLERLIER
jgi:hypothetical protein